MREYRYFYAEIAITYIHSMAAYGIIISDIRQQYEGKSYRMFSEWLVVEAYYLRTFLQLSHVPADKAYDSEENHVLVRDVYSMHLVLYQQDMRTCTNTKDTWVKIQGTNEKRGYCKLLYTQLNKNETIVSVIKRLFGEHIITSRLIRKHTTERIIIQMYIAYNIHRLTNLIIIFNGFY